MMRNYNTRRLVVTAALIALMVVLQLLGVGIVPIPPAGVTILHVPIIVGTLLYGLWAGVPLGLAFGVMSLIMAYSAPTMLSFCFLNPLVSILPRLLIPLAVWGVAKLTGFYGKRGVFSIAVSAVAGSLCNTVVVLASMMAIYGARAAAELGIQASGLLPWAASLGAVQGLPEAAVAAVITMAVVKAVDRAKARGNA